MGCGTAVVDNYGYAKQWFLWMFDNQLLPEYQAGRQPVRVLEAMLEANPALWENFPAWADALREERYSAEAAQNLVPMLDKMYFAYRNVNGDEAKDDD